MGGSFGAALPSLSVYNLTPHDWDRQCGIYVVDRTSKSKQI